MGIELLHFIQSFHSGLLDTLFIWITKLGNESFYLIFLPFVYWIVSRDLGFRLTLILLTAALTNGMLKNCLMMPRPSPEEGVRILYEKSGTGFGFPSGHAQDNTAIWGYLAVRLGDARKYWYWLAGAVILLVGLSRIYLGLHYPGDVLGGVVFGLLIVAAAVWLDNTSERWTLSGYRRWLFVLLPLVVLPFYHTAFAYKTVGFMVGTIAGFLLDLQYVGFSARSSLMGQAVKLVVGYGGFVGLRIATDMVVPPGPLQLVRYGLLGLWATLAAPAIFSALGLVHHKEQN
jgi:membrane-associated phospholipid phosphatase